jgi:REP element-mobilizing transposase RayT
VARSLRIEYPGAFYHVMARGNRREAVFLDDDDRRAFLEALGEACQMTGWRVHAWVLMRNHYHLFLETPEANLVAGMSWLQNTITRRFNVRHRAWGRLFGDRYKAVLVEGGTRFYYRTLMDYIHLNAVRAGLIKPSAGESVLDFPWSSVTGGYALDPKRRPPWLAAAAGLAAFDLKDTPRGRREMVERLDGRTLEESPRRCGVPVLPEDFDARASHLRRGWYWGSEGFAAGMIERARAGLRRLRGRTSKSMPQRRAHGLWAAEAWLEAALKAAGLEPGELVSLRGSDPRKLAIADRLWRETIVSQAWIADHLHMRSAANVSQQLRRLDRSRLEARLPRPLRAFLAATPPGGKLSLSEFAP